MMGGYYFNPNPSDAALERNSLWAWDGRQWSARAVLPRPGFNQPPEVYPGNAFCFDESRGVAVMFGPFFDSRQPVCEWDGVKWSLKFPAELKVIESRVGGSAFYDPIRRLVGLPIVGNNLQPYVAPLSASVVFWDGSKFQRGDNITINDLTGTKLTNSFQQWFKDGVPILDEVRVTGAATATLKIPNATASDAGAYTLRVGNVYNQVMSPPIQLGVQPDGVVYVAQGSGLVLSWPGATGILETSPTPNGPWTPIYGVTPPYSVAQDEGSGFYRVRYP